MTSIRKRLMRRMVEMMTVAKPMAKIPMTAHLVRLGSWRFQTLRMGRDKMAMSVRMFARPVPSQPAWGFPQCPPSKFLLKFASNG